MLGHVFSRFARYFLGVAALLPFMIPARAGTIMVSHWGSLYYGAPFAVAQAKGYFKEHHVDITSFAGGEGGGTDIRNTLASDIPYGDVSLAAAVEAIRAGVPLHIINTGVNTLADFVLITRKGSDLKSFKELKGKKIAYTKPGSVSQMAVVLLLHALKIDPKDVHMISVGGVGAAMTAIQNGTVDAGFSGEPLWSAQKNNFQVVGWLRDAMDVHFTQMVGVVKDDYAKAHPDIVKGIVAARRQGVDFIYAHPKEAADIVAKAYNQKPALVRKVFASLVKDHYWSEGKLQPKSMEKMLDGLRLVGALKGDVDLNKMLDTAYLPKDLQ